MPVTKGCCKVFLLAWVGNHFLLQSGGGQTFIFSPLDIIFIIVNHVINTSFFTPPFTPPPLSYSRNLSILLQFKVFWGGDSKRRCYASSHSRALLTSPVFWDFVPFFGNIGKSSRKSSEFRKFWQNCPKNAPN